VFFVSFVFISGLKHIYVMKVMGIKSGLKVLCLLFLYLNTISIKGQCDLQLLDVDFTQGTYTIAFNNTENCGGTGGPDGVSEIQIGFQAIDPENDCSAMNQGWTFPSGITISSGNNHPGWIFSSTSNEQGGNWTNLYDDEIDPPYYTGEVITFPLYNQYQQDCSEGAQWSTFLTCQLQDALQFWIDEGLSIQAVIWQISYGPTMYADDGGWAEIGANGDGTSYGSGLYEDDNFEDNWLVFGPCGEPFPEVIIDTIYVELPCDTITILETDTLYITQYDTIIQIDTLPIPINWYFYDTTYIYVELPPDTVIETVVEVQVITDTLYVELPPDTVIETEFIFETDTIFEIEILFITDTLYITLTDTIVEYQFIEVDCATGLPCNELGFDQCDPLTVFIPNTFTPNNDGYNDVWEVVLDPGCWGEVDVKVYNRWGDLMWESFDPYYVQWDGSYNNGAYYVPDGVYYWTFTGRKINTTVIEDLQGHVTIFR